MATKKGPQIYLNDSDPAERQIFEWSETLGRGRKSLATIEAIIAGRAIAQVCQPIADLLVSASRRGESVSLEQLSDYIRLFSQHEKNNQAVDILERSGESEPDEPSQKTGFNKLGM
ncbi:hypothetical protein [Vibrio sp. 10N.261.46.A3]|uniref:hypothetical protein n=1 Tax=Vibrio sp. 10N.261.46.A3 TaxID=3229658 RepID=UPI00354D20AC